MDAVSKKKILIVCCNNIVRKGIFRILNENDIFYEIGELSGGIETIQKVESIAPDVVLIDYHLRELNAIDVAYKIHKINSKIKIVILTSHTSNRDSLLIALEKGVSGILDNSSTDDELILAINTVSKGQLYLTPTVSSKIFKEMNTRCKDKNKMIENYLGVLTAREREVVILVSEGLTCTQIADKLYISDKTVRNHRANLMSKLDLHSTAEIVKYAIRNDIVSIDI